MAYSFHVNVCKNNARNAKTVPPTKHTMVGPNVTRAMTHVLKSEQIMYDSIVVMRESIEECHSMAI